MLIPEDPPKPLTWVDWLDYVVHAFAVIVVLAFLAYDSRARVDGVPPRAHGESHKGAPGLPVHFFSGR